jgi:glycosyl transferase family 25
MRSFPIFVINLDRSPERLALMRTQALAAGLRFERVRGLNGIQELPTWAKPQFLDDSGRTPNGLSAGEVGCYASHLLVMSKIVERGLQGAIVLEDDAVLDDSFARFVERASNAVPDPWDCIHLSTRFKRPAFPIADLGSGRSLVRYMRQPINSTAYMISLAGAAKLAAPRPRTRPFDVEFRQPWLSGLEVFGIFPALVRPHEHLASTIDADWKTHPSKTNRRRATSRQQALWKPGLASQIQGWLYVLTRLGITGALHCWATRLRELRNATIRSEGPSSPRLQKAKFQ